MANIRIKDLANTASSTASDDFIGIDGATNGTRKLNAYSPSFGGNATVAGTLTVNGGIVQVNQSGGSDVILLASQTGNAAAYCQLKSLASPSQAYGGFSFEDAGAVRWFIGGQGGYVGAANDFNVTVNGAYRFRIDTAGVSRVLSTTDSSSTSTGALVVSGGVGVAGAAYVGGNLVIGSTSQITNTASVASGTRLTLNTEAQQGIDIFRSDANANFSGIRFRNSANSATNAQIGWNGTTLRLDAATVEIPGTTASTSTSTGALVVGNGSSGGLGVGGQITAGGNIVSQGTAILIGNGTDNSAALYATGGPVKFFANATEAGRFATAGNLLIGTTMDAGEKLQVSGTAAISGAISIGNTVNTVSPTSPNRTITMVIGGTTYYIHAKTTND